MGGGGAGLLAHPVGEEVRWPIQRGDNYCILMRHMPGKDLDSMVKGFKENIPVKIVRFYAQQMVIALQYSAHLT